MLGDVEKTAMFFITKRHSAKLTELAAWLSDLTDYQPQPNHEIILSIEDAVRKQMEWDKYHKDMAKEQLEWLKLAMANDVSINIHGDATSVHSLFKALDNEERIELEKHRGCDSEEK